MLQVFCYDFYVKLKKKKLHLGKKLRSTKKQHTLIQNEC